MHLKRLELYGFKSFADKVVIEFDKGITGVVGPNGSGKSNIGDAMRWVLGEQSAHSLRGSKMEDVIFDGSRKRSPLAWCEVTLIFDNSDGVLETKHNDLAISRRFYRSGESEYSINRKKCRRKDVIELFRDTGIGREGYSIIGQGRIDNILSSKSDDRRNIFHEAAGIMKYRARRDESGRRLEHTRENIQRLCDIMEEMERQLKPLKRQCSNARSYLKLSNELKDLEINRFVIVYKEINERIKELKKSESELTLIEKQCVDNVEKTNKGIDTAQENLSNAINHIEKLQGVYNDLLRSIDGKKASIQVINERINFSEQTRMRIGDEIENARMQSSRLLKESQDLDNVLKAKVSGRHSQKDDIEKYRIKIDELNTKYQLRQEKLDLRKAKLLDNMNEISDVKTAAGRYEAMTESLTSRKDIVTAELSSIAEDEEIYSSSKIDLQKTVDLIGDELKQLKQRHKKTQDDLGSAQEKFKTVQMQSSEKETKLKKVQMRISMLKSMQRDYEGYDSAARYLLKSSEAKDYFEGIVADIIDVPNEFTKAIDAALGRAAQNVITYDEYDAKTLIKQLRQNRAGRTTFLPLVAIKGRYPTKEEKNLLSAKGCIGIGAELITYDDRYKQIIHNLLGRTIICEDMDTAITLSKRCNRSCRFVTLDGDMVNPGGSISGGIGKSSKTSILNRRAQIQELENDETKLLNIDKQAKKQLDLNKDNVSRFLQASDSLLNEINEMNIASIKELEKMERLNALWNKNNESKIVLEEELNNINNSLNDLTLSMADVNDNSTSMAKRQEKTKEHIQKEQIELNILGEELDELQAVLNNMLIIEAADEKELENVRKEINRLKNESKKIVEDATNKKRETLNSVETIDTQKMLIQEHEADIIELNKKLEEITKSIEDAASERKKAEQTLEDARQTHEDSQAQILDISEKKFKLQNKLTNSQLELDSMQERMWDIYELTYANALPLTSEDYEHENSKDIIESLRRRIKNLGPVNVNALDDYTHISDRYNQHKVQYDDLISAENDLLGVIDDLNVHMQKIFEVEFKKLNNYFSEAFCALFGGGEAQLVISDEENTLDSGIDIIAQPPGKKLQHLSLLSGGEKALTATAILFAMLRHRPSPFCLLDEIESALDEANLNHFAKYLTSHAKNTQFMIITHRQSTMDACDSLYGITMEEKGISKMISVKISDYA